MRHLAPALLLVLFSTLAWAGAASTVPTVTSATCGKAVCTWNAFGPSIYIRATGDPITVTKTFLILNPNTNYTLHIENDGVASAIIWVNGTEILGPSDFNPNVTILDRSVTLQLSNEIAVQLRSKAGSSLTVSISGVDNDPPIISDAESPAPNAFGWNNTPVTVSFICGDTTSGVGFCTPPLTISTEGLEQTATGVARDLAGNSTTLIQPVNIDLTPPTITASVSPAANAAGWNNTDVAVSFNCSDALSGVLNCASPVTVTTEGAGQQVSGSATDYAGNTNSASLTLNIDRTPPALSISSPAEGSTVNVSMLSVSGTISDSLSGVASVSCNGVTANISGSAFLCTVQLVPGFNTVQVQASDVAGNQAGSSVNVTFNAGPAVPPKAIFITPGQMNVLLSGGSRTVSLVSDQGTPVFGAQWSIADPSVIEISSSDPPVLTPQAAGSTTITASLDGLSATATITVYDADALPVGVPAWAVSPLPGDSSATVQFADKTADGMPDVYAVENGPQGVLLRGLTGDGRQLWASRITTTTLQAAAPVLATTAAKNITSPLSTTAVQGTAPNASLDAAIQQWQALSAQGGPLGASAGQVVSFLQRLKSSIGVQSPVVVPKAGVPSAQAVQPLSSAAPIVGGYIAFRTVPDTQGGVLLLLFNPSTGAETLVRADGTTGALTWRYDPPSSFQPDIAVHPDGTIFALQMDEPPNSFSSDMSVIELDSLTGALKGQIPVPSDNQFLLAFIAQPNDTFACVCSFAGPIAVAPDGFAYLTYATAHVTLSQTPTFDSATQESDLFLLKLDTAGGSSSQLLRSFTGTDTASFYADGALASQHFTFTPFPTLGETIPDGEGGLLAGWSFAGGGDSDCAFSDQGHGFLGCTPESPIEFDARLTHLPDATETVLPMYSWGGELGQPFDFHTGATMVLGDDSQIFATDEGKLLALGTNGSTMLWNAPAPAGDVVRLVGSISSDQVAAFDPFAGNLLIFDSTGNPTSYSMNLTTLSFDDSLGWLGLDANGMYALDTTPSSTSPFLLWTSVGGTSKHQRYPGLKLKCTSVTRGDQTQCTLVNGTLANVAKWQFTDAAGDVVTSNSSSNTWAGIAVQSGTVTVTLTNGKKISATLSVHPRPDFSVSPASPLEVKNGTESCGSQPLAVDSPPGSNAGGDILGMFCLDQPFSIDFPIGGINKGPNQGFWYVLTITNQASYHYVISPDLEDSTSQFSAAQCGNYDRVSNPDGFISWQNLLTDTVRHESGTVESHYENYVKAQSDPANNIGVAAEHFVKFGTTDGDFLTSLNDFLKPYESTILQRTKYEPCGGFVNYDATCTYQGAVNYSPYQSCTP